MFKPLAIKCCLVTLLGCHGCTPRAVHEVDEAPSAVASLPEQIPLGSREWPIPDPLFGLVFELQAIEADDAWRYSREKRLRWEAALEELAHSAHATRETMVAMLGAGYYYDRAVAAHVLGIWGEKRAVDALISTLRDDDPLVRACAALALGRIGHRRAVPALVQAMQDEARGVRREAARALGYIPSPEATKSLIAAIKVHEDTRYCDVYTPMVIVAMWPVTYYRRHSKLASRYSEPASWALVQIGPPAVTDLVAALEDPTGANHVYIAWALAEIAIEHRDERAIGAMIAACEHSDSRVRELVTEALPAIGIERSP